MDNSRKPGWLLFLLPLVLCLPCLLAPLALAGGAVFLAGVGGFLTCNLWVVVVVLVLGGSLAAGLYLSRRRRAADACCLPEPDTGRAQQREDAETRG
jgi:hypothetical protein